MSAIRAFELSSEEKKACSSESRTGDDLSDYCTNPYRKITSQETEELGWGKLLIHFILRTLLLQTTICFVSYKIIWKK